MVAILSHAGVAHDLDRAWACMRHHRRVVMTLGRLVVVATWRPDLAFGI